MKCLNNKTTRPLLFFTSRGIIISTAVYFFILFPSSKLNQASLLSRKIFSPHQSSNKPAATFKVEDKFMQNVRYQQFRDAETSQLKPE
jgi:hypothetical protein